MSGTCVNRNRIPWPSEAYLLGTFSTGIVGKQIGLKVDRDEELTLKREPDNEVHSKATISAHKCDGCKIGYLPAMFAEYLAGLMDKQTIKMRALVANGCRELYSIPAEIFVFAERKDTEAVQRVFKRAKLGLKPIPVSTEVAQLHESSDSNRLVSYIQGWDHITDDSLRALVRANLPHLTFGIELELGARGTRDCFDDCFNDDFIDDFIEDFIGNFEDYFEGDYDGYLDLKKSLTCLGIGRWRLKLDSSIETPGLPVEVISPILDGRYGILEAIQVLEALLFCSPCFNPTCGLHIHAGWKGITDNMRDEEFSHIPRKKGQELVSLLKMFTKYEEAIDLLVPRFRRGNRCRHAKSMVDVPVEKLWLLSGEDLGEFVDFCAAYGGRYLKVNVQALKKHGTIEWRHPGPTSRPEAVVGFLLMHLTFVEAASSHSSSSSSPSSIIPDYSISLSLGQKLELLGWKDVAMLSGREQELLVGLAEVLMSCSTDETIAKYLINWLPKQAKRMVYSRGQKPKY